MNALRTSAPTTGIRQAIGHALGLSAGPVAALGLARFAYALLLPAMREDLHWTYTQAGAMNTANALGYLAGAAGATWLVGRAPLRPVFLLALTLTTTCLFGCAAATAFPLLALLRLAAGAAGAVTFVVGATLAVHAGAHLTRQGAAAVVGVYVAGGGLGIVVSGVVLPPLLAGMPPGVGWRAGWLVLGLMSVVALAVAAAATTRLPAAPRPPRAATTRWPLRPIAATGVAYLLFGIGYVGYTTFVIALLRSRLDPGTVVGFWIVLGLASALSAVAWGPVVQRFRAGRGLTLLLGVTALGAAVSVVAAGPVAALASAVLFGTAFLSTTTAVTEIVRRTLPARSWGSAIAALTVGFSLGQCAGPVLTGALSDQAGLDTGLALSATVLAVAALVALAQPTPHRTEM